MQIMRKINGVKIPITLSDEEIYAAYLEQEHRYALQDMRTVLTNHNGFNETMVERIISRDELAAEILRLYDKYSEFNSTWYNDMKDAIHENMDSILSALK